MIPAYPVYIFDVDGTLMDSAADICGAIRQVIGARGRDGVSDDYLRRYIGRHLLDLFQDLDFPRESIDQMIAEYRELYLKRSHGATSVFPGIPEMLARLSGRKSTATTKGSVTTRAVLEQFGLIQHFEHVQGTDGFPAKPQPDVILRSIEKLGVKPEHCLLVGDAPADMEAGKRAGVHTCAVMWGYGSKDEIARWAPDYWIEEPADLIPLSRTVAKAPQRY